MLEPLRKAHGLHGVPKPPEVAMEERQQPQGKNLIKDCSAG